MQKNAFVRLALVSFATLFFEILLIRWLSTEIRILGYFKNLVLMGALRLEPKNFVNYSQFFFLGAGFLLLETRAILAVAVLFGSTWLVNSVVILLILLMALAANLTVQHFKSISSRLVYSLLFVSLVVLYLVPLNQLSNRDSISSLVAAILVIGLPFYFAGLVFSRAYAESIEPNKALGINILGAILGGCLEYSSVIIGTRDLVIISIILYGLAVAMSRFLPRMSLSSGRRSTSNLQVACGRDD